MKFLEILKFPDPVTKKLIETFLKTKKESTLRRSLAKFTRHHRNQLFHFLRIRQEVADSLRSAPFEASQARESRNKLRQFVLSDLMNNLRFDPSYVDPECVRADQTRVLSSTPNRFGPLSQPECEGNRKRLPTRDERVIISNPRVYRSESTG